MFVATIFRPPSLCSVQVASALLLWTGGCLGVVTQLTVQLVPSYDVHELKYYDIPCDHFIEHFFDMLESCTSFNANPAWSADTVMCTSLQTFVPLGTKAEDLPAEAWPETCFGGGTLATVESPAPAAGVVGTSGVTRWNTSLYLVPAANIMDELQIECKQHDEASC